MTSTEPRDTSLAALPPPRLLLVDDQPSVLLTFRIILEQHGFRVTAAHNAAEAVAALQRQPFDLLLSDLALDSAHDGFDVVAAARRASHPPGCLLLTGYATPELSDRAARENLPLLFKPVNVEELVSALRRLLAARASGAAAGE